MQFERPQFTTIFEMLNVAAMGQEIKKLQAGRPGREFELFVMYVFERAGFSVRDVAQNREITGIDCVLSDPRTSQTYAHVQAKQFSTAVGVEWIMGLGASFLLVPT